MKVGDRRTIVETVNYGNKGSEKASRSGTVVYIHPQHRFCTLMMDAGYRESFPLKPIEPPHEAPKTPKVPVKKSGYYTPAQIDEIVNTDESLEFLAKKFGRTEAAIDTARYKYRRRRQKHAKVDIACLIRA